MSLSDQILIDEVSAKRSSIRSISKSYDIPYMTVYARIKKLIQDNKIDRKTYDSYKKESHLNDPRATSRTEILAMMRDGIAPMRIAEKLETSRQYVYEVIKIALKNGEMTPEEYKEIKKTKARKKTENTLNKESLGEKIFFVINDYPSLKQIREKLNIPYARAIGACEYLVSVGKITREKFEEIRGYDREKDEEERMEVIKKIAADYEEMSMVVLAKKYDISLKSVQNYIQTAVELGFLDKKTYKRVLKSRKTFKPALTEQEIQDIIRMYKVEKISAVEIAKKYDRCSNVICKIVRDNSNE